MVSSVHTGCPCLRPPFWVVPVPKTPLFGLCPCLRPTFLMCCGTHPPVYIESAPPPSPGVSGDCSPDVSGRRWGSGSLWLTLDWCRPVCLYPLVAPPAPCGRDALDLTYDPVHSVAGQAERRQKRLYDQRAVKRIFAFRVTCTLGFLWLSPYLFVSFCGWPVGVQLQPDSVVLCVHC